MIELLTHVTWVTLKDIIQKREARLKRAHTVWFHLYTNLENANSILAAVIDHGLREGWKAKWLKDARKNDGNVLNPELDILNGFSLLYVNCIILKLIKDIKITETFNHQEIALRKVIQKRFYLYNSHWHLIICWIKKLF